MVSQDYLLERQFEITKKQLDPDALVIDGMSEMLRLIEMFYNYLKGKKAMDKQINKVKKDVIKGDKPKAKKDIAKLLKMDKKQDKKVAMCAKKMPAKKGRP